MKIASATDYYSVLERLLAFEEAIDRHGYSILSDEECSAYEEEIPQAVAEYLRELSPMLVDSVGARAPSPELREEHARQKRYADDKEHRYLRDLACRYGIEFERTDRNLSLEQLRMQVVTRLLQNQALHEKYIQNRKQRIKEQGRIVQCQMCALGFHSVDTERIKPYGSTRYERFCKPCAAKVKEAKAIYQGMVRKRLDHS